MSFGPGHNLFRWVLPIAGLILAACGPAGSPASTVTAEPSPEALNEGPTSEGGPPTATPTERPDKTGTIRGRIGYPSSFIPAMQIFAVDTQNEAIVFSVSTQEGQAEYEIRGLPAGMYHVFAYLDSDGGAGGFTEFVPCGLAVDCQDHSLIDVEVSAAAVAEGVDILDWYAPPGTFPDRPVMPGP